MHEGPVLLVDNAVGDEEAEEAHTDQAQTHKQKPLSLTRLREICTTISAVNLSCKHSVPYLDEGKSADDDDPNAAEHDAQKIEQNSKLARLGTSLRILACRRGVQS